MLSLWVRCVVALAILFAHAAHSAKLNEWREYTSDNFILYSDRSARESERLLNDFERFRYAALAVVETSEPTHSDRTHIYLFRDAEHYQLVQPDQQIAGFYKETLQGARMVVGAEANLSDIGLVLFHEYTHHITRQGSKIQYPLWYEEGFADLLAAAELHDGAVTVGQTNSWRESTLKKHAILPLAELFQPPGNKDNQYWDRYYASAWLFVHYLQLNYIREEPERVDQLRRFLVALHYGDNPSVAFTRYFSISLDDMDKNLKAYANQRYWSGYKIQVPAYQGAIASRTLSQNETAFLLGDLSYRAGQPESALQILQYVDASDSSVAPALSLRAILEAHKGQMALANHFMSMALTLDGSNTFVATNAAHLYWDWSVITRGKVNDQQAMLNKVAAYARQALHSDVDNLEAGRYLARSLQKTGQVQEAITVMQTLYSYRPTDVQLNLELGKLLVASGQPQPARKHLNNVLVWDHSLTRRQIAQQLLSNIKANSNSTTVSLSEVDKRFIAQ